MNQYGHVEYGHLKRLKNGKNRIPIRQDQYLRMSVSAFCFARLCSCRNHREN